MLHVIVGIVAVIFGIWGVLTTWMICVEILKLLVFLGLVGFGVVAVLAGLKRLRTYK